MKLLLDSSYLLPYVQIAIEGISQNFISQLKRRNDLKLCISDLSFVEIAAKYLKLNLENPQLTPDILRTGLDAIRNENEIEIIAWVSHPLLAEMAGEIRKIHPDFFDCMIFATAILEADAIATFDETLYKKIINDINLLGKIKEKNPKFEFWIRDFHGSPKYLL